MSRAVKPVVFGCAGLTLTEAERDFFTALNPFGFILFHRPGQYNCNDPVQVRALTDSLRACTGRADTLIFIDQEGGRVARLKPPYWPALPAPGVIGKLYVTDPKAGIEAMRLHAEITAQRLLDVGVNVNCAPILDQDVPGASIVMGDRTFGADVETVTALGRVAIDTYLENGVLPVIKHLPGHGRVKVDPHEELPFVDATLAELEAEDFLPFKTLNDAPLGMNCHVVFRAIDPDQPVSFSAIAHREIIRGALGYQGLVISDDMMMKAHDASLPERARRGLEAGADIVLYGVAKDLDDMRAFAEDLPNMSPQALQRWQAAQERLGQPAALFDVEAALLRLKTLIPSA